MKKLVGLFLAVVMTVFLFVGCGGTNTAKPTSTNGVTHTNATEQVQSVKELKHTEYFSEQALHHIFEGEINNRNKVVGYHYEGLSSAKASVEDGTRSKVDKNGVYTGKVYIGKQMKDGNNGYSTFYPKEWTAQQVVDAINYAWEHKTQRTEAQYIGKTKEGITITFYIDNKTGKIATAYPNKEKD